MKLVPINQLAHKLGAKVLLFGPPGTGKTPMVCSINNAAYCAIEQGLSSVRNLTTPAWNIVGHKDMSPTQAFMKFHNWAISPQCKFETIIYDSLTELANIFLKEHLAKNKDGRKAYGEMSDSIMGIVHDLCRLPRKNIVFLAQMATEEVPTGDFTNPVRKYNRPLFPGRKLEKEIPHCIDEILYVDRTQLPNGQFGPAIHTVDNGVGMARSRCGKLNPLEPCDLNYLFNKINS